MEYLLNSLSTSGIEYYHFWYSYIQLLKNTPHTSYQYSYIYFLWISSEIPAAFTMTVL